MKPAHAMLVNCEPWLEWISTRCFGLRRYTPMCSACSTTWWSVGSASTTLRSHSNGPSARRNLGLLRPPRGGNTGRPRPPDRRSLPGCECRGCPSPRPGPAQQRRTGGPACCRSPETACRRGCRAGAYSRSAPWCPPVWSTWQPGSGSRFRRDPAGRRAACGSHRPCHFARPRRTALATRRRRSRLGYMLHQLDRAARADPKVASCRPAGTPRRHMTCCPVP